MVIEAAEVRNISSTEERKKLLAAVKEISNSMARIEGENDYIKDATKKIVKDFVLPKKIVSKLIKTYHKQNFDEQVAIEEQFQQLYTTVTGEGQK